MKTQKYSTRLFKFILEGTIIFATVFCFFFFCGNISQAAIKPSTNSAENDNQRIIQEVAATYYLKGDNIQYESQRRDQYVSPEDINSQSASYFVCSGFTYATYYNAFGMVIPENTTKINAYGKSFFGQSGHEDVVVYEETEHQNNVANANYHDSILNQLKVGDIISYYYSDSGHAALVYDFNYSNGNKTEAIILHSTTNYDKTSTKLSKGLSWNNAAPNPITGVDEGTVQYTDLRNILNMSKNARNFTIYRPLALANDDQIYNLVNCDGTGTNINNYTCTSQTSTFDQKDSSLSRITYKGIQIEKTVDVFNGSVVEPGDTLTYTISITNNSDSEYNNISLVESIPTDLVVAENGSSILNWNVDTIPASTTYRKNYRVKVKNDKSLIGKKIISKGTVANIPSSTVTNTIGYNLNTTEKTAIESAYNDLKNTYSGINLIDKIYQKSLGYSLELTDLKLAAHHNTGNDSNNIKNLNQNCNSYFESTNSDALLNTVWGLYEGRNEILNQDHPLAKNVLNNYYSALFTEYQDASTCSIKSISLKNWETANTGTPETANRSERSVRIYPETLKTGDILLYANTGSKKDKEDSVTKENGIYAFIWIEDQNNGGNFYGANSLADGSQLNKISGTNGIGSNNLQTLFGKDYYVILRPSITMTTKKQIDNHTEADIAVPDTGIQSDNNDLKSSESFIIIISLTATLIIAKAIIFYIIKINSKHNISFNKQ